jgi:hypothetical protein
MEAFINQLLLVLPQMEENRSLIAGSQLTGTLTADNKFRPSEYGNLPIVPIRIMSGFEHRLS